MPTEALVKTSSPSTRNAQTSWRAGPSPCHRLSSVGDALGEDGELVATHSRNEEPERDPRTVRKDRRRWPTSAAGGHPPRDRAIVDVFDRSRSRKSTANDPPVPLRRRKASSSADMNRARLGNPVRGSSSRRSVASAPVAPAPPRPRPEPALAPSACRGATAGEARQATLAGAVCSRAASPGEPPHSLSPRTSPGRVSHRSACLATIIPPACARGSRRVPP